MHVYRFALAALALAATSRAAPLPVDGLSPMAQAIQHHVTEEPALSHSVAPPHPKGPLIRVNDLSSLLSSGKEVHSEPSAGETPTAKASSSGAKPTRKRRPGRRPRSKPLDPETAARVREEAIPPHLRDEYKALPPPVRGQDGTSYYRTHTNFWAKVVAHRDRDFDETHERRAKSYILRHIRDASNRPRSSAGPTDPNKKVRLPPYVTETMRQLSDRQEPYIRRTDGAPRQHGTKLGDSASSPQPPMTPQEKEAWIRERLRAALVRTDPAKRVEAHHVVFAERYIRDRLKSSEGTRLRAQCRGRGPPGRFSADSWCHETEDVLQLAQREMAKNKYKNKGVVDDVSTSGGPSIGGASSRKVTSEASGSKS